MLPPPLTPWNAAKHFFFIYVQVMSSPPPPHPPAGSCSDSVLNAGIMNQPRGAFVALQQQANEISSNPEGPLTT